jgi:MFS family permease
MLYVSIGLISFAYSLSSNTISNFLNFATSAFDSHSLLGTIEVAIYVLGAVGLLSQPARVSQFSLPSAKPFIAKLSDITSRPVAYFISLIFYVFGFIVVACSSSVQAVAAGLFPLMRSTPLHSLL